MVHESVVLGFGIQEAMSASLPLFDQIFKHGELTRSVDVARALRDRGIEAALEKAERVKREYIELCLAAIKEFPKGARITSEDVREKAGDPPSEIDHSVLAGIFRSAKAQGLIMITREMRQGKRVSLHAKFLSIWVRL